MDHTLPILFAAGSQPVMKEFKGRVISYARNYTAPKFFNYSYLSPYLGHVILSHLKPSTKYIYSIQMNDAMGKAVSSTFQGNFTTLPKAPRYPLRIGVTGDIGQTDNSTMTRDFLIAHKPQVHIQVEMTDIP